MGVIEFLCDRRFHRSFVLPQKPKASAAKPFRVSYADYGDSESDAVVLFCGALMGMRFCYSPLDQLAKIHHVRIIHPDRPGIGGSDAVEQSERMATWLEIVPQLLAHLNISHVSIASHSGGDIYALNTILTYPNLLHPTKPYITFFAPWVHHSHSGVSSLRATELLPAPVIGQFASMARFINNNVTPLAGMSSSFLHGLKDTFHHSTPAPVPVPLAPTLSRTSSISSRGGPPDLALDNPAVVEEMRKLILTYLFAEVLDGIGADAQLFLKKPHSTPWCAGIFWSDVDYVVPLLLKIVQEDNTSNEEGRKWTVDAFHAETDHMVGEKGRLWFDSCWAPAQSLAHSPKSTDAPNVDNSQSNNSLEYRSQIVPGSDHDYLMDPMFGAAEQWLQRVREAFPNGNKV